MNENLKKVRNITINTDASYHPDYKVGGYAFYIVCDLFKITRGGMFNVEPQNHHYAEIMCIANAISTLLAKKELPLCKQVIINTDSMTAIRWITDRKHEIGIQVSDLCYKLRWVMGGYTELEFRHVKAHNGARDKRSWVNEWCDANAKRYMTMAIQRKLKKQNA